MEKRYEVVEDNLFVKEIDKLEEKYPRIFEIKALLSSELWLNPYDYGTEVKGKPTYYILRNDEPFADEVPRLDVLYQVDEINNRVTLIAAREIPRLNND